ANPVVLSVVELQGSYGNSLAFGEDGTTVYVGTPETIEAYTLVDAGNPQHAGTFEGLEGEIALSKGVFRNGNEQCETTSR
ncbi:hypothetical protein LCGC14_0507750, partial [marine sediment metagenome]